MEEMLLEQLTAIVITHGATVLLPIQIFKIILGWKVDLEKEESVGTVRIYNRGDGDVAKRLSNFDVILLDKAGNEVTRQHIDSLNNQPTIDVQFSGVNARYVKSGAKIIQKHHLA